MKLVVVIFGQARHGKDTVADLLVKELDARLLPWEPKSHRTSFVSPIKRYVEEIVGVPANLDGPQKETVKFGRVGWTARRWWQWFGTDFVRFHVDPDHWPKLLAAGVRRDPHLITVVSDGRFSNERTVPARELAGEALVYNVLVYRPSIPDWRPPTRAWRLLRFLGRLVGVPVQLMHPSESEVREMRELALSNPAAGRLLFDALIYNGEGLDALREQVENLAVVLRARIAGL